MVPGSALLVVLMKIDDRDSSREPGPQSHFHLGPKLDGVKREHCDLRAFLCLCNDARVCDGARQLRLEVLKRSSHVRFQHMRLGSYILHSRTNRASSQSRRVCINWTSGVRSFASMIAEVLYLRPKSISF